MDTGDSKRRRRDRGSSAVASALVLGLSIAAVTAVLGLVVTIVWFVWLSGVQFG